MTVIHAAERDGKEHQSLTAHIVSRQERALASFALSGAECAPYVVSESSWIDHPAYPYSGFGGGGFGTHHGVSPTMGGAVDSDLAVEFYKKLGAMKGSEQTVLFRATERLARSRSHPLQVDQAIDLGIAAEMIFLHEMSGDRGELRFRTALRAAWLLGKDGKERRAVFDCMRKAYDARSAAVHTGALEGERLIENPETCGWILRGSHATAHSSRGSPNSMGRACAQ
jgi:Apea-like HEPN